MLISSPTDLGEEREVVAEAIEELNLTWRKSGTIQLNLIRWETDARPALGKDAQAVINAQIGEDYDIFIGIMGARFGTPTGRAESGTEEEFEKAAGRFQTNPTSVSVMFYFKDTPPMSLSDIDPVQLSKVQAFQDRLKSLGLVRFFKTRDEFARLMRMHLSQEAQEWAKRIGAAGAGQREALQDDLVALAVEPEQSPEDEDEEGYLDLIERGAMAMEEVTRTIERIGAAVNEIGTRAVEQTAAMEQAKAAPDDSANIKAFKRVANQMAVFLSEFVARLEAEIPIYGESFRRAIDPFMRAMSITEIRGETPEQMSAIISSVETLISNHEGSITSYAGLRDSVAGTPRITTAYNQAKRRAVVALNSLIEEFEKSLRLSRELYEILIKRRDGLL